MGKRESRSAQTIRRASAQSGDVVCDGLDLAIVEIRRHVGHLLAVLACAGTERDELGLGIVGMLAGEAREQRWVAGTARVVATGAGRNAALGNATAINLFTQTHQVLVLREAGLGLLARIERGDVLDVGIAQWCCHALHDRVVARAGLELGQLLGKVLGMLPLQNRVGGAAARAVVGVAGRTDLGRFGLAFGQIGLGCNARFSGVRRDGKRSEQESSQQGSSRLHGRRGFLCKTQRFYNDDFGRPMTEQNKSAKPEAVLSPEEKAALAWAHTARFLTTASELALLPQTELAEIAFVGRSKAGKSTAINMLTQQKRLAFASKTPGRTQHINLFELGPKAAPDALFADLPGYGYAAVARGAKLRWQQVMADYLEVRRSLAGVVLMVDSRLGFTELDTQLLGFIAPRVGNGSVKLLVLLTKSDKLNRRESNQALAAAQAALGEMTTDEADVGVALFSALSKAGIADAAVTLHHWTH